MSLPTPYYEHDSITIYHADCRKILPAIPDATVDMIWTDPPYGHRNNEDDLIGNWEAALGRKAESYLASPRPISNDGVEANALVQWLFKESARLLKPSGSCCCCCGGGGPDPQFARWALWMDEHLTFKQMIVWDKGKMGMGWHYRRSYETVLIGHRGQQCRWYDETNKIENIIRHIPKIIPSQAEHPTLKPKALVEFFLRLHSQVGDLILDPFLGSGTTLCASKDLNRKAIGIEIEEKYCEIAAKRLEQEVFQFE